MVEKLDDKQHTQYTLPPPASTSSSNLKIIINLTQVDPPSTLDKVNKGCRHFRLQLGNNIAATGLDLLYKNQA